MKESESSLSTALERVRALVDAENVRAKAWPESWDHPYYASHVADHEANAVALELVADAAQRWEEHEKHQATICPSCGHPKHARHQCREPSQNPERVYCGCSTEAARGARPQGETP